MPTLKVEIPTVTEGETGTITFTLSPASSQSIEFGVNIFSGVCGTANFICPQGTKAASSSDFSGVVSTITFAIGETTKTYSFTATDDNTLESTEVFAVVLGGLSASEATIDPTTPAAGTNSFGELLDYLTLATRIPIFRVPEGGTKWRRNPPTNRTAKGSRWFS